MNDTLVKDLYQLTHSYPGQTQKLYLMSSAEAPPEKLAFLLQSIPGPENLFQSCHRTISRSTTYSEIDSDIDPVATDSPASGPAGPDDGLSALSTIGAPRPAPALPSNSWAAIAKQATPPPVRSNSISLSTSDSRPSSRAAVDISKPFARILDLTNKPGLSSRSKKVEKEKNGTIKQEHPNLNVLKECDEDQHGIYWSKNGTRIDPCPKWYNKEEVERVKKLKLCNIFHLRPPCHSDKKCVHNHTYKPTQSELDTLALVARMSPCQNGPMCEDNPCIYGHNCPAPRQANLNKLKGGPKAIEEGKLCIFGVECFFNGDMHYYVD
jgi:hypothetical protein